MKTALETGPRGGKLNRGGRPKGAKSLVRRTFEEFAKATLHDPEIQKKIRERLLLELAGKVKNPLPALSALAAAAVREKPSATSARSIVFIAEIVGGRGSVTRLELGQDQAIDAEALPALPEAGAE